jgi:hypothetical protein
VNPKQIQEMENQLGRPLTPEEIRLLQYTEKKPLEFLKEKTRQKEEEGSGSGRVAKRFRQPGR